MVAGAQTKEMAGRAALLVSENLYNWELLGDAAGSNTDQLDEFGYMWECPDLFRLNGKDVLIVSPQGLEPEGNLYQNVHQSGYFVGELDYKTAKLNHGEFTELDRGFDFYAPQTTVDEKGRRLLIAWMSVPDQDEDKHPTIANKWIHTMTFPRKLSIKGENLLQEPVEELKALRKNEQVLEMVKITNEEVQKRETEGAVYELILDQIKVEDSFKLSIKKNAELHYSRRDQLFTLTRISYADGHPESRKCHLAELTKLQVFVDTSSIEVFINDGEEVFTARMFPDAEEKSSVFSSEGETVFQLKKWDL
jgi:beta-fructofuranosidase